jgi:hypothetical protein
VQGYPGLDAEPAAGALLSGDGAAQVSQSYPQPRESSSSDGPLSTTGFKVDGPLTAGLTAPLATGLTTLHASGFDLMHAVVLDPQYRRWSDIGIGRDLEIDRHRGGVTVPDDVGRCLADHPTQGGLDVGG